MKNLCFHHKGGHFDKSESPESMHCRLLQVLSCNAKDSHFSMCGYALQFICSIFLQEFEKANALALVHQLGLNHHFNEQIRKQKAKAQLSTVRAQKPFCQIYPLMLS